MITPDPVLMTNESGRTFEFELGRFEKAKPRESLDSAVAEEGTSIVEEEAKWVQYKFNQKLPTMVSIYELLYNI